MPELRRSATTAERLGRMLVIVPYLVQHPGTSLASAAEIFGVPREQLRRDLDLLFMSGLPPYGPGDLIDVDVDEDGGVWISMADHFARPLRLTRPEALAVYLRATELLATPGIPDAPALASALAKLRDALGPDTLGDAAGIEGAVTGSAPAHLDALRAAAADLRRIRIDYTAASACSGPIASRPSRRRGITSRLVASRVRGDSSTRQEIRTSPSGSCSGRRLAGLPSTT